MTDFQKTLEQFYVSMNLVASNEALFYERRAKQYQSDQNVIKTRVVSIANQIKAFGAMYLEKASSCHQLLR